MNRRNFLRVLAGSVPAAVVAPTYFFAPVGGWYPDRLSQPYLGLGVLTAEDIRRVMGIVERDARLWRQESNTARLLHDHRLNLMLYGNSTIYTRPVHG